MSVPIVTVFGGSGFIGRYVAQRMARAGWRVRVAVRRPDEAYFVRPYGVVGQVEPIQANIRDEASTRRAIAGADAVINCVGVLAEAGPQTFEALMDEGAGRVARIAAEEGVGRLVHVSAIGADPDSDSRYAAAKGRGEAAVRAAFPGAVILRPSILFGTEDAVLQPLRARWRGCRRCCRWSAPRPGSSRSMSTTSLRRRSAAVTGGAAPGVYELGGPEVASFRELMRRMLGIIRRRRRIVGAAAAAGAAGRPGVATSCPRLTRGLVAGPLTARPGPAACARQRGGARRARARRSRRRRRRRCRRCSRATSTPTGRPASIPRSRNRRCGCGRSLADQSLLVAALLGVLEGLTEFIPVSSTGHILLAGHFLGFHSTGKAFEVLIQLGAILAILTVYAGRLLTLAKDFPTSARTRRFVLGVLLAFLPAVVLGVALHGIIKTVLFETPVLVAIMLVLGGIVLLWVDRRPERPRYRDVMDVPLPVAFGIGLFQCLALVPGVSRSGSTIVGAMLLGADKRSAAEFSFFLSMPTMAGAFAYDLFKNRDVLSFDDFTVIAVGFVCAFVAAVLVVRSLLGFVSRRGYARVRLVANRGGHDQPGRPLDGQRRLIGQRR